MLQVSDIVSNEDYLKVRPERRKDAMALKDKRRIAVGPNVTFLFENKDTLIYQIQEIIRSEGLSKQEDIALEVKLYNELMPKRGMLNACLFIEVNQQDKIKATMDTMLGLNHGEKVFIAFGEHKIPAVFEEGRSKEDRISALQYVRFYFSDEQMNALAAADTVKIEIDHTTYQHSAEVDAVLRSEWLKDLMGK